MLLPLVRTFDTDKVANMGTSHQFAQHDCRLQILPPEGASPFPTVKPEDFPFNCPAVVVRRCGTHECVPYGCLPFNGLRNILYLISYILYLISYTASRRQMSSSRHTAWQDIPSPVPVKPSFSSVVAFTFTLDFSISRAAAMFSIMVGM